MILFCEILFSAEEVIMSIPRFLRSGATSNKCDDWGHRSLKLDPVVLSIVDVVI